jgi:hypothetical protein
LIRAPEHLEHPADPVALAWAEQADEEMRQGREPQAWVERRGLEHDNVRAWRQGDYGPARTLLEESLARTAGAGGEGGAREAGRRAAQLYAAAAALRETLGAPVAPADRAGYERRVAAVRACLGEEGFAAAWAEGQTMTLHEAVALALKGDVSADEPE